MDFSGRVSRLGMELLNQSNYKGWAQQPSLEEFENLLSSQELLAKQLTCEFVKAREENILVSDKKNVKGKLDIAASGVNILATFSLAATDGGYNEFKLMSGTSMSAPHVAGIVALIKAAHPSWLLLLLTWNEDTYRADIFSEGTGIKLADPFDFGGGICNPNGAADPDLIYDMDRNDYSNYLCSLGYSNDRTYNVTMYHSDKKNSTSSAGIVCPKEVPSRLDMNL
ncbi:hypothetical protein T459_17660 [Capsicum annuum]|uniref:Peptidase S8/S53 domain-containing protein n=1 Tax=Capsicum annuum TaxID=4072 RepID=A0A2G2ZC94_CAPAN|nr:hypothetical protein T459_17660 [Capsicum annuum]